jgi:putative redox protein
MKTIPVNFTNAKGQKLAANLEMPLEGKPYAYLIFAHCFTCNKNLNAVRNISRALSLNGIAVLRFDFTGLGQSEGEFEETSLSHNVEDIISAAAYLALNYKPPTILIGHSFGGTAILMAASRLQSIKAVVTINAPFDPGHVKHLFKNSIDEIKKEGKAEVNIGGRSFYLKEDFIYDLDNTDLNSLVKNFKKALLVMHSPQDKIVAIDEAANLYKAAMHPKSFISLDGMDHLLSNEEDSIYIAGVVGAWVKRYIPMSIEEPLESERGVMVRTGNNSFTTEIKTGKHFLIADEPESFGGKNLGPTPYDYLLSSLGACTGMTLQMYAKRKSWPLENVMVFLKHGKIHAEDSKEKEGKKNMIDHISVSIQLEGNISPEQKEKLLEIAHKCPVHKTLHSEIRIDTELKI